LFKFDLKSEISEIENNVIRFKIDFPPFEGLTFVCMYLLKIDGSHVLIDAGLHFTDWKKKFFTGLKEFDLSVKKPAAKKAPKKESGEDK